MSKGKYRHRIEIQEEINIRNPETKLNEKSSKTLYTCWAEIDQRDKITGGAPIFRELYQAFVERNEILITFNIRYKKDIHSLYEKGKTLMVMFAGSIYKIEQVKPDLQFKKNTSILCKKVV